MTWALFAAGLATFAELYTTQPLLPLLSTHFGVTAGSAALSVSVTTLTLGIALLFVGPMSEVIGRTKVMMISLFGASVMAVACVAAPTWGSLLALRGLLGFAVAGLPAVAVAYLREEVAPSAMARATGQYIGGTALGGMSGRLVAGALADVGGWRLAVAGIGVLGLVCAIFVRAHPAALAAFRRRPVGSPSAVDHDPAGALGSGAPGALRASVPVDGCLRRGLQRHGLPTRVRTVPTVGRGGRAGLPHLSAGLGVLVSSRSIR